MALLTKNPTIEEIKLTLLEVIKIAARYYKKNPQEETKKTLIMLVNTYKNL